MLLPITSNEFLVVDVPFLILVYILYSRYLYAVLSYVYIYKCAVTDSYVF